MDTKYIQNWTIVICKYVVIDSVNGIKFDYIENGFKSVIQHLIEIAALIRRKMLFLAHIIARIKGYASIFCLWRGFWT